MSHLEKKEDIIGYLITQGIPKGEFVRTYKRYIWNLEYCEELIEKDLEKQVIKTKMSSQACPVCESNVNGKYCPNCGQRLKY